MSWLKVYFVLHMDNETVTEGAILTNGNFILYMASAKAVHVWHIHSVVLSGSVQCLRLYSLLGFV